MVLYLEVQFSRNGKSKVGTASQMLRAWNIYPLRIHVCPKKGINPTNLLGGWIGTIKPTLGKGMDP